MQDYKRFFFLLLCGLLIAGPAAAQRNSSKAHPTRGTRQQQQQQQQQRSKSKARQSKKKGARDRSHLSSRTRVPYNRPSPKRPTAYAAGGTGQAGLPGRSFGRGSALPHGPNAADIRRPGISAADDHGNAADQRFKSSNLRPRGMERGGRFAASRQSSSRSGAGGRRSNGSSMMNGYHGSRR